MHFHYKRFRTMFELCGFKVQNKRISLADRLKDIQHRDYLEGRIRALKAGGNHA